ncbi:MAG: S41 family peptidase [Bacteroidota bacterium]
MTKYEGHNSRSGRVDFDYNQPPKFSFKYSEKNQKVTLLFLCIVTHTLSLVCRELCYMSFLNNKNVFYLVVRKYSRFKLAGSHQTIMKSFNLSIKFIFLILTLVFCVNCVAQSPESKFNLDFEKNNLKSKLPDGWFPWGNYDLLIDSVNVYSGVYSALIVSDAGGSTFGSIAYRIPAKYKGSQIVLEGYMKTENVENGFAGLLLRIDGNGSTLAFDNMQSQDVKGTNDWDKYTVKLNFPQGAEEIFVAGILVGNGKAWFDNFTLSIDGKNIQFVEEIEKEISKVQMDKEFDNGSGFKIESLTDEQKEELFKIGKIWGFLKYYHPLVAKGEVNWDYELFRILPKTLSGDFNSEVLDWIKKLGPVSKDETQKDDVTGAKLEPPTYWISDHEFTGKELSEVLTGIKNSIRENSHYYVSLFPNVKNPNFQNENAYPDMRWDDTGYRLLALFRYWNMIEYFFPYKNLIEKDWDNVLNEYIPKVIDSQDELSYKLTMLELIGEIHDTHANIWSDDSVLSQFFGTNQVPVQVRIIEDKAVVTKITDQLNVDSKIQVGDIITQINGIETEKIIAEKIKHCPASNYPRKLYNVSDKLLRTNDNNLTLTLENRKLTYSETVNTVPLRSINFKNTQLKSHSVLNENVGYIYPAALKQGEIDTIMNSFLNKKGVIVDLRCYPSDNIVFSLGRFLMPEPVEFVKFSQASLTSPGLFTFTKPLEVGEENEDYYKGKVVILVDESTISQAEYTTMALRVAPDAVVIGSSTAGADGNVSTIMLPGNIRTMISGIGVYYPDGTETQRVGIVPDIEVKPTIEAIREGRDEYLEKALEIIGEKKN